MATSSDDFNRSDENPISDSGDWVSGPGASGDMQVVSNRVRSSTAGTLGSCRRGSPTFASAQSAQLTIPTRASTNDYIGPATRINSTTDADQYYLRPSFGETTMSLRRIDDTGTLAETTLGATFGTFAVGDVLKIDSIGILHVARQNGTIVATRVDTTYASGQPGILVWAHTAVADVEGDDWSAQDIFTTRLYLPASGASPINFGFAAGWEKTSEADRIRAYHQKTNTTIADKTCSENVSTNPYDVLARQYAYGPLAAQTIAGTVRGICRTLESNSAADFRAQIVIKVMDDDGTTVRGTLLDFDTQALKNEFPTTTAATRFFPLNWDNVTLTSVAAQEGDYLVIEIGIRSHNGATTNRTATFRFGDPTAGSDFTEVEGTTADNVPWIEFDSKLILQTLTPNVASPTITVTEDHRAHILLQPNIASPTIVVTESSTVEIQAPAAGGLTVDTFDSITIVEFHHEAFVLPTIADGVTVAEFSTVSFLIEPVSSDTVTVEESFTVLITTLKVERSDSVTLNESVTGHILIFPAAFDLIAVEESVDIDIALPATVSDEVAVSELGRAHIQLTPASFDSVTTEESVIVLLPFLSIDVSDSLTLTEAAFIGLVIQVSDSLTIDDVSTLHLRITTEHIDPVFIEESIKLMLHIDVVASSAIMVEDPVTATIPFYPDAVSSSSVTVADEGTVVLSQPLLPITVSDDLTLIEFLNLMFPLNNPVEDSILVQDSSSIEIAGGTLEVTAYDEIGALTAVGRLPALTLIE